MVNGLTRWGAVGYKKGKEEGQGIRGKEEKGKVKRKKENGKVTKITRRKPVGWVTGHYCR